jgi:hypothetical protein
MGGRETAGWVGGLTPCPVRVHAACRALFRGYPTTVFMNIPYAATVVSTNETLKKVFDAEGARASPSHTMSVYLLCGAASGAAAAALTNPLDVVKTRLQTQSCVAAATGAPPCTSTRTCATSMVCSAPAAGRAGGAAAAGGGVGVSGGGPGVPGVPTAKAGPTSLPGAWLPAGCGLLS